MFECVILGRVDHRWDETRRLISHAFISFVTCAPLNSGRVESGLGHVTCCDIITCFSGIIGMRVMFVLGDDTGWTGSVRVNCVCVSRAGALVSSLMYSSWQLMLIYSEYSSCVIGAWRPVHLHRLILAEHINTRRLCLRTRNVAALV